MVTTASGLLHLPRPRLAGFGNVEHGAFPPGYRQTMISWTGPALMIGCYTALLWAIVAGRLLAAGFVRPLLATACPAGAAATSAPKILELAGVGIDQPLPWTAAALSLGGSHRTDARRIAILPGAAANLGHMPGVAASRRPRLVAVLAMVPEPRT